MHILLIGPSIIEHCLTDTLGKSFLIDKIYLIKPNLAFANFGVEIRDFTSREKLIEKIKYQNIDVIFIPFDVFNSKLNDFKVIGIPKKYSQLEFQKKCGLEFMDRFNINHPPYKILTEKSELHPCIEKLGFPLVLKADGNTGGLGVSIVYNKQEAEKVVEEFLAGKFGEASKTIIAQKFIKGKEYSLMSFFDGNELISMPLVKDFKKRYASDKGPNTGSMGSILDFDVEEQIQKKVDIYTEKLKLALKTIHADFTGVVYSGLIFDESNKLYVLEYNMRLGNPEGINILSAIKNLDEVIIKWKDKKLKKEDIIFDYEPSICLNIVPKNYPLIKGEKVSCRFDNIKEIEEKYNCKIYFNKVKIENNRIYTYDFSLLTIYIKSKMKYNIDSIIKELEIENGDYRRDIYRQEI